MHTYDIQKFLLRGTLWLTGGSTSNTDGIKSESGKKVTGILGGGSSKISVDMESIQYFTAFVFVLCQVLGQKNFHQQHPIIYLEFFSLTGNPFGK